MKYIITNIGKGTYGNSGTLFTESNFFRIDSDIKMTHTETSSNLSDYNNDVGFITLRDVSTDYVRSITGDGVNNNDPFNPVITMPVIPQNISAFTNDVNYITDSYIQPLLPATGTGTVIDLSRFSGTTYNYSSPLDAVSYTFENLSINGFARVFVNGPTEPSVTNAQKVLGSDFIPNTTMEMIIDCPDGVSVEYYFIEK